LHIQALIPLQQAGIWRLCLSGYPLDGPLAGLLYQAGDSGMQRRGLFRTEYAASTLRGQLELARPANPHTLARSRAA
jgi:hypothetical protein